MRSSAPGFLSSHDPREVLGIGQARKIDLLEIRWPAPSQRVGRFTDLPLNRYFDVTKGRGADGRHTGRSSEPILTPSHTLTEPTR
jgi:hypothetical protein